MRSIVNCMLALALGAIFAVSSPAEEGVNGKEATGHASKEGVSGTESSIPSSLFETLRVGGNACYAFIEPDEQAAYFGPLVREEVVKKLDGIGGYVHVWIPRLMTSGWVLRTDVHATNEPNAIPEHIPMALITAVSVRTKLANVREGPTTRSAVIFVAERGREFRVLNEKKGWFQIWIPRMERKGWISGRIVERQDRDEKRR